MDHPNVSDERAAWALILAAAVPTAAAIRLGWLVLGGSWDGAFGFDPSTTGMQLLGDRWSNLWWLNPATPTLLMAGVLPLLLLAIVVATGRPRVLVPTRAARFAATAVAAITALVGMGGTAGFLAQFTGLLPVHSWPVASPSELDVFAPFAAVVFAHAILGLSATVLLWPRRAGRRDGVLSPGTASGETSAAAAAADVVDKEAREDAADAPTAVPGDVQAVRSGSEESHRAASLGLPTPSDSDLVLYRRR